MIFVILHNEICQHLEKLHNSVNHQSHVCVKVPFKMQYRSKDFTVKNTKISLIEL